MASIVKSAEYLTVSITAATEPVTVNLTKSQTFSQCVPFFSVRNTGSLTEANYNFFAEVEIIDNAGTAAVRVSASARLDADTSIFQIFVVEFALAIGVQQAAVTGFTGSSATVAIDEISDQATAFLLYSHQWTDPTVDLDDWRDVLVQCRFNGVATDSVLLSRRSSGGTVNGTLYVVNALAGEFTVDHREISTADSTDTALSIDISTGGQGATVLVDTFLLHSYESSETADDQRDGAWMADLQDTNTVRLRRTVAATPAANSTHNIQVVECQNSEWDVQRGQVTMATATVTDTITAIDQARTIISMLDHLGHPFSVGRSDGIAGGDTDDLQTAVDFSADTTVRFRQRAATRIDEIIEYEVVQFVLPAAAGISVTGVSTPLSEGSAESVNGTTFEAGQGTGTVKISPTDNVADAGAVTQTITSWSDTIIAFTTVQGALALNTNLFLFVTNDSAASNASGFVVQIKQNYELDFAERISLTFNMGFEIIPPPPPPPSDLNISLSHQWFYGRW